MRIRANLIAGVGRSPLPDWPKRRGGFKGKAHDNGESATLVEMNLGGSTWGEDPT